MTVAAPVKVAWRHFMWMVKKWLKGVSVKLSLPFISADETADVGKDETTQVVDKVFKDVEDSVFTGYVEKVTVSIPKK